MMNSKYYFQQSLDYDRVAQAIEYVQNNFKEQPRLEEIATSVHLSKFHFQRLFKNWAGVSPTQFMHFLTIEYAKTQLRCSRSIYETALDAGLSSASRLHDLFINFVAMTPGEYKNLGATLEIHYGFHPTPFGECLLATTQRGICGLRFITGQSRAETLANLEKEWSLANFLENPSKTQPLIDQVFSSDPATDKPHFQLLLKGTNFQVQVWLALLLIPSGAMVSYQDVAKFVSLPTASRAIGKAIGCNPVAYLIPCHRVISKTGNIHNYRWGTTRKQAILGWEAAQIQVAR